MSKLLLCSDGSHTYRYAAKQIDLSQVNEKGQNASLTAIINGCASIKDFTILNITGVKLSSYQQTKVLILDKLVAYGFIIIAITILFVRQRCRILSYLLYLITLWCFVDSICAAINGGNNYAMLTPYSLAIRTVAPLLLALALSKLPVAVKQGTKNTSKIFPKNSTWITGFDLLSRLMIASTFFCHGYKALAGCPSFQDLLLLSARQVNWQITPKLATSILLVIGWQDVLLALLVILFRSRIVLYWVAIWGMITAFSRITAMGWYAYDLSLVRIANGGLALVILALYYWREQYLSKNSPSQRIPLFGCYPL